MRTLDRTRHDTGPSRASGGYAGLAWIAVATIPVFAVLAFVAGEVALSVLGHPSGGDAPVAVSLTADVIATVVALIPCAAAIVLGRRARAAHEPRAVVPIVIGAVVGAGWVLLTLVTEIGNAL